MSDRYELYGVSDTVFKLPGFMVPIFKCVNSGAFVIQVSSSFDSKIERFFPVDCKKNNIIRIGEFPLHPACEISGIEKVYSRCVSEPQVFAIRFSNDDILIAEKPFLLSILLKKQDDFNDYPAIQKNIAVFCNNPSLEDLAKKRLKNSLISRQKRKKSVTNLRIDLIEKSKNKKEQDLMLLLKNNAGKLTRVLPLAVRNVFHSEFSENDTCGLNNAINKSVNGVLNNKRKIKGLKVAHLIEAAGYASCQDAIPIIQKIIIKYAEKNDGGSVLIMLNSSGVFGDGVVKKIAKEVYFSDDLSVSIKSLAAEFLADEELYPRYQRNISPLNALSTAIDELEEAVKA